MATKEDRTPSAFGRRILDARKSLPALMGKDEFSQQDLADALGKLGWPVQAAYISRLESGDRGDRFEISRLPLLAKALKVRLDWLAGGEGLMRDPAAGIRHPERERVVASARKAGIYGEAIIEKLYQPPYDKVPDHRDVWWNEELRKLARAEFVADYRAGAPDAVREGAEQIKASRRKKAPAVRASPDTRKKRVG